MKLMLLDGNSLINRAFYGIRMLNAPDGTPTNAVYGFLSILQRLLDEEAPDSLLVAFDVHAPTFRHLEYSEYKAGRRAMPDELRTQIPLLKEILSAMDIPTREIEGWEADDILGTVSHTCASPDCECVIVTGDKDSLQLINEHTRVLNVKTRMGQTETINYTVQRFEEEYGFEPVRMIDLKSLMGDASDNIPGVKGIGEKTALDLLHTYGSLQGLYDALPVAELKPAVRKKLEEGRDSAEMSYHLATIVLDAPIDFSPSPWKMPVEGEIYDLFLRLGLKKFIDKWGLKRAGGVPVFNDALTVPQSDVLADVPSLLAFLEKNSAVYLWAEGDLSALALVREEKVAFISSDSFTDEWKDALSAVFAPKVVKGGHNVKNLLRTAFDHGVEADGFVFDTALAAYLLDATAGSYDIERLCMKYLGFEPYSSSGTGGQLSLLSDPAERIREFTERAASLPALETKLRAELEKTQMTSLFESIEMPLCPVLADMEHQGFLVDRKALIDFGESLTGSIESLQRTIWTEAGHNFNINSPKQLGTVLFEELGLPGGKKTKTGWSTNADILEKLSPNYPIVKNVLEYRELTKLKSTYAEGLLKVIAPDGRIHTSFQMTVTATGRLSSTEPNLQNIPVRRELGAGIRKMFVASPGCVLVDADYSQIELRLLAHISGDEVMRNAFITGEDIHRVTASQVFGIPLQQVSKTERSRAKAVNFGIVYGISAFSLAQDIGVFVNEAKGYMEAYLSKYSGIRDYQKNIVAKAKKDGYVETVFHRRRYLPELNAPQFPTRAFGERVAMNMPIQGTAADVIKLAMVRVATRLKEEKLQGRLILQVHDELIVECPESEKEQVIALLEQEMQNAVSFSVPLIAEAKSGASWAEAH